MSAPQARGKRAGRKRKSGPRYQCGKRMPIPVADDPRVGLTLLQRARRDLVAMFGDARLGSEVMRLGLLDKLTEAQVQTAQSLALTYGRFERVKGAPRRSVASPSYERGFGGGVDEDRMDERERRNYERFCERVTRRYHTLQQAMGSWPERERSLIERLCVEDRCVAYWEIPAVRAMLDELAPVLGGVSDRGTGRVKIRAWRAS